MIVELPLLSASLSFAFFKIPFKSSLLTARPSSTSNSSTIYMNALVPRIGGLPIVDHFTSGFNLYFLYIACIVERPHGISDEDGV